MAYSRVVTTGDGSTKIFAVNFAMDYLLEADVTCRVGAEVDGGGDPVYRDITFISTNVLEIAGAAPGNGVQVIFDRTVDKDILRVDFSDGDIMDEDNLNTSQKQLMMAVHELLDGRTSIQSGDFDVGDWRIINLGTPTGATDATTKAYVDAGDAAATAATAADRVATAADRVQTGLDVNTTAANLASTVALFDLFDDRWLGSKTSNPALDNDGNALLTGALYWNSSIGELRVYSGAIWVAYSPTVGMADLVDDTTPQLGGDLALNGHVITGLQIGVNVQAYDSTIINAAAGAAAYEALGKSRASNTQAGNYTIVLTDNGKPVRMTSASANVLTVPANSSVAFPIDTYINVEQYGAGQTTLVPGGGVTIRSRNGLKMAGQYAMATLHKIGTDEWMFGGDVDV